jgi:hypothetical protein
MRKGKGKKGKRYKAQAKNCPLPFAITKLRTRMWFVPLLFDRKVFLAVGKGFITLGAEIFKLGMAI